VNTEDLKLLQQAHADAEKRFESPGKDKVSLQDVLQIDVEIGRQRERRLTLERMRRVAVARLNTLLHLSPDAPLPPPPTQLPPPNPLPDVEALRQAAVARRPDLQALQDHVRADQAALALACKEYYPDVEVMAAYDTFWQERPLRPQVGVRVNLPVRLAKRDAAVAEARARVAQRIAELNRQTDQALFEVEQAFEQAHESEQTVLLYDNTILRDAKANVEAAQPAYRTGQIPAQSLVEAERNLTMLRDRYYEAAAEYFRRRAALERAVGGPLAPAKP
jgi:outer membrane protein TolC